ncbi:hypothetical protein C8F04DRAFT_1103970 [Mycena alexandri]|uniref:Uncharacterized protein n=1 Tax=Mycena alexandri TaxID=1745969 RepID=A0AAD6SUL4_9AGAR|nr:hypothetical protein C8F04DRAFT_1103970 [Mycena alexandri]
MLASVLSPATSYSIPLPPLQPLLLSVLCSADAAEDQTHNRMVDDQPEHATYDLPTRRRGPHLQAASGKMSGESCADVEGGLGAISPWLLLQKCDG